MNLIKEKERMDTDFYVQLNSQHTFTQAVLIAGIVGIVVILLAVA